ncbi:MAG TPA: cupin domain-containing protein [Candidatus Sulfotelmatobacter sp.]|nr:cupin domain-containing protein [Candidatus Sulfotelmatobacter sp.]
MDIRRFGPGHRRPEGPPGTTGVSAQVLHQDARGSVAELAFTSHAMITPHDNHNTCLFVVVSGGGFVQVGEERARVMHGEAVLWPADVLHGAYTDGSEMRAIVVELTGPDDGWARGLLDAASSTTTGPAAPAEGTLSRAAPTAADHDRSSGEPW